MRDLPPPAVFSHGSASMPFQAQQQGGQDSGPIAWLGRNLNPGNWILDAALQRITDPQGLAGRLDAIPGVVEHGLFIGLAQTAILAGPGGTRVVER